MYNQSIALTPFFDLEVIIFGCPQLYILVAIQFQAEFRN